MFQVQDGSIIFNPKPQEAAQMKAGGAAANEVQAATEV